MLHYPVSYERDPEKSEEFAENLKTLLANDSDSTNDAGEIISSTQEEWNDERLTGGMESTYNCCTYALADVANLTTSDWISPCPLDITGFTNPTTVLLNSCCRQIWIESDPQIDLESLESNANFEDGDIFCFVVTHPKESLKSGILAFAHVGKIQHKDGRNWLVSKLGVGPIVRSGLAATGRMYQGEFDQIRVYRPLSVKL